MLDEQITKHCDLLARRKLPISKQNYVIDLCYVPDIVEGMVNKGIFLNGDNGGTFLHFGNYQNSCISDPTLCGPEGERTVVVQFGKIKIVAISISCINGSIIL